LIHKICKEAKRRLQSNEKEQLQTIRSAAAFSLAQRPSILIYHRTLFFYNFDLKNGYIRVGKYCPNKPQKWILSRLTEGRVNDIESGRAEVIGHRPDGSVIAVYKQNKKRYPVSVWNKESHNAETQGSSLLNGIFSNGRFPYPKSLYAVFDCLKMFVANNPQNGNVIIKYIQKEVQHHVQTKNEVHI